MLTQIHFWTTSLFEHDILSERRYAFGLVSAHISIIDVITHIYTTKAKYFARRKLKFVMISMLI